MKNWQKTRNYKKVVGENGTAYYITVDGQDVEVSEEVYLAYSQMERRERYILDEMEVDQKLSLESFEGDDMKLEFLTEEHVSSAEEILIEEETEQERLAQMAMLRVAMETLDEEDRNLINALYYEGLSTRQYAAVLGVTQRAVMKRKQRIISELKKYFLNS